MKVIDVILLPLAAALVLVGAHMTVTQGILASYPIFMFAVALLFWFRFRRVKSKVEKESESESMKMKKKKRRR